MCFSGKQNFSTIFVSIKGKLKDTKAMLEKAESAEFEARAKAHEALEHAQASLKDQAASSKSVIGSLQLEIKSLKSK